MKLRQMPHQRRTAGSRNSDHSRLFDDTSTVESRRSLDKKQGNRQHQVARDHLAISKTLLIR